MNVVVTGANRGLGLAFVSYYLQQGHAVWACYRSNRGELSSLDSTSLTLVQWDVTQPASTDLLQRLPQKIDLLINNAGVFGPDKKDGQSLDNVKADDMLSVYDINCVGALRVVQALKDRIILARGIIANISSRMGSSADNTSGGCYAYRAAKAALVIVSKSMAVDLKGDGVRVITLHPGWVRTDMTRHTGEIDVHESVQGMCAIIADIDRYEPGSFVAWNREVLPY
jgi:NAD(P)-dependent dehydrogenase (short-subunit alcohol dehydrogenase family)